MTNCQDPIIFIYYLNASHITNNVLKMFILETSFFVVGREYIVIKGLVLVVRVNQPLKMQKLKLLIQLSNV